jgi:acetyl esterase/lipase
MSASFFHRFVLIAALLALHSFAGEDAKPIIQSPRVPEGVKAHRDLEYAKTPEKTLLLDLFVPEKADSPVPVIVWIHGGAWRAGNKTNSPALPFAAKGFAVASITYRFSHQATYPAQIEDCKAAIRWLRANAAEYKLNPDKIGVWGQSAGGHLASLLGTTGDVRELDGSGNHQNFSSRVQAVCDWFGPTDFLQMQAHMGPAAKMQHDAEDSPESLLIGGAIQENKNKVAKADPITYVTKDDAPFLIMHGEKDPLVPLHQSEILRDALAKAGIEAILQVVGGAGHGFSGGENLEPVEAFFNKHLKSSAEVRKDATSK